MTEDIYRLAWHALLTRIEEKTSWGRNVLKDVMLDCLVNAPPTYDIAIGTEDQKRIHRLGEAAARGLESR